MSMDALIRETIQTLGGSKDQSRAKISLATVNAVDIAKRTCTVTTIGDRGNVQFDNVQLMASVDDGLLLVPAIDSTVIVSYTTFNQPYVSLFSGIDKVILVAGENNASIEVDKTGLTLEINNTKLVIADGQTTFNDGSLGGLVKVIQLTQKLNNLENLVNDLITKYNSHTHILTLSTGTGTAAPTTTTETQTLTPTQREDIENTAIKQG